MMRRRKGKRFGVARSATDRSLVKKGRTGGNKAGSRRNLGSHPMSLSDSITKALPARSQKKGERGCVINLRG